MCPQGYRRGCCVSDGSGAALIDLPFLVLISELDPEAPGPTESEGENVTQRTFHAADDTWQPQAAAALPMGKPGQVDEIADFVVFLLSERSGVVTGSVIGRDQNVLGALD